MNVSDGGTVVEPVDTLAPGTWPLSELMLSYVFVDTELAVDDGADCATSWSARHMR